MNRGFTLIETLIYLSLFSLLLWSIFSFTASVEDLSQNDAHALLREEEGAFVIEKVAHALREATSAGVLEGKQGDTLTLSVSDTTSNPLSFFLADGRCMLKRGESPAIPLTSTRLQASNLQVTKHTSGDHADVTVSLMLDTKLFQISERIQ